MAAKGRHSSGQRRAAKVKSRKQRLAEQEAARERHARLVVERSGDPRFVQQERRPDGGRIIQWDQDSPAGAMISSAMERQAEAFRKKFDRDPGPDDPVFFDPGADVPVALAIEPLNAELTKLIDKAEDIGVNPGLLKAWQHLGYVVTAGNQHLFSAAEVDAWNDAVNRYWSDDLEFQSSDEPSVKDVLSLLADSLGAAVSETLMTASPEPARRFADTIIQADINVAAGYDDDNAPTLSLAFGVLARWLTGVREEQPDPGRVDVVLDWITSELGSECANRAQVVAGFLGAAGSDLTVQQAVDQLQEDFLPALIWLAVGLVATYGNEDVAWIRRHDPGT